jgi:MFS family permease
MLVALSVFSAGFPLGSVIGNIYGGVVAEYANWKW